MVWGGLIQVNLASSYSLETENENYFQWFLLMKHFHFWKCQLANSIGFVDKIHLDTEYDLKIHFIYWRYQFVWVIKWTSHCMLDEEFGSEISSKKTQIVLSHFKTTRWKPFIWV
jgi:hypothetical protein